jgi:DNA-binding NtrC family response regulator
MQKEIKSISRQVMEMLTNCPWKGNVRELANLIERSVILTCGEELKVSVDELRSSEMVFSAGSTSNFRQAECAVIMEALRAASGRIAGKGGAATHSIFCDGLRPRDSEWMSGSAKAGTTAERQNAS